MPGIFAIIIFVAAQTLTAVALGWPNRGGDSSTLLRPISLLQRAQPPDQLYAGHRPGCARCSTQHGGSDHRRPSNLETGAPVPTPFAPKTPPSTKVSLYVFLHLHSSFTGYPVAWVTKPHPSPPHRPPRWLLPTTTLCSAETDPNSPRCPCPSPSPANAESMLSKDDTPEPAVL